MNLTKQFEHLKIQLEAIKCATSNFSDHNCIGRGGFGRVYKGSLVHPTGLIVVAVKRLDPAFGQGNPEFWKEIIMLSLYKHENVVTLIGYCDEGNEKILVYEFAARRSLDLYLNKDDLTWIRRLKICIGVARGLAYLHNPCGTQQRVLHRDLKSSNILLDGDWNAKISDLGLSKFGPANQKYTFCVSNVVGTLGYCDPVYIETGVLTKESDVYSFGVVLFEVLCGRLCISNKNGIHESLIGLVRRYYPQNKINEIICGNIKDGMHPKSLEMFTTIAYRCLKRDLEDRPLMSDVISVLESALEYQESDPTSQPLVCDRSRERKRGVPLTEDDNRLFLIGLQKVGKGDWRGISRNFVKTRTPTQVAIHAQKYFLRRTNHNRRRRRSSLFDITTDTESDLMTTNITPTSQPLVCITCNSYSGRCWVSFDVMRNKWMSLPEIPTDQDTSNIYAFETRSLAVGSELLVFQTYRVGYQTWKYNLVGQNWIKCDGMYQHRFYFGSATLGSIAIVAGGTDENINSLKSAELYDSSRGSWERLSDMHSSRQLCACFFMDEKFYVIGGRSNTDWLTCGEEFDLKTKIWRKIEGMYHNVNVAHKQRPLVAVVSNELYAVQYMSTMVIKYNKNNNSWDVLGRLPVPIRADSFQGWGMAFKACGEGLLVVGGQKRPQGEALALYYWSPQSGVKDGVLDWKVIGVKEHAGPMFNVDCAVMGC